MALHEKVAVILYFATWNLPVGSLGPSIHQLSLNCLARFSDNSVHLKPTIVTGPVRLFSLRITYEQPKAEEVTLLGGQNSSPLSKLCPVPWWTFLYFTDSQVVAKGLGVSSATLKTLDWPIKDTAFWGHELWTQMSAIYQTVLSLMQMIRIRAHSVISHTGSKLLLKAIPPKLSPLQPESIIIVGMQHVSTTAGYKVKDIMFSFCLLPKSLVSYSSINGSIAN